ncbi:unnamed protein product [Arctogadus glacialis]
MSGSKASAFHLASDPKPPEPSPRTGTPLALPQSSRAQDRAQTTGIRTDDGSNGELTTSGPAPTGADSTGVTGPHRTSETPLVRRRASSRYSCSRCLPETRSVASQPTGVWPLPPRGPTSTSTDPETLRPPQTVMPQRCLFTPPLAAGRSSLVPAWTDPLSLWKGLSGPSVDRPTQPLEGVLWFQRGPTHSASGRGSLVPAWSDPLSLWKGLSGPSVDRPTQPLEGVLWFQCDPTHSASGRAPRAPLWNNDFLLFSSRFPF